MYVFLIRVAAGALAIAGLSLPTCAFATESPRNPLALANSNTTRAVIRRAKVADGSGTINGPGGCNNNGSSIFFGFNYANQNYAAGAMAPTTLGSYSSVINGSGNESCDSYTTVVDGYRNIIGGDGGGSYSFIGTGAVNQIEGQYSFIGSGYINTIGTYEGSNPLASYASAIVGGASNTIAGEYSFIGGGSGNSIDRTQFAVIGGGDGNVVTYDFATIAGGLGNRVTSEYGTVAGGFGNIASGIQAAIGGGYENTASGKNGTIPGGTTNTASGTNSFAAGTRATADFAGDFVWSDYVSGSPAVTATAANEFVARATGGFLLYSSTTLSGVALAPGSGAWSTLSDRNVKTGVEDVDDARILAKLTTMPVTTWSYKAQGEGVRHLGPMAQDFRAAFGLGEDDRHISTVDEEGVALAAIKALASKNEALEAKDAAKDAQIMQLRNDKDRQIAALRAVDAARFAALEQRLAAIESLVRPHRRSQPQFFPDGE